MSIPVIDIAPFLHGVRADKCKVASEIANACETAGFFCIIGHGVSAELILRTREVAAEFFALPEAEKRRILREEKHAVRGFYPFADAPAKASGLSAMRPNLLEAYAMGPPDVPDEPRFREGNGRFFFAKNLYPVKPEAFRETVDEYFRTITKLGNKLIKAMALALGHDEDYFDKKFDQPACVMRLLHYPAQDTTPADGQSRFHAHTDYGTLTILRGDNVAGGLQVKLPEQGWVDVRPPPNAFVCNLGDTMARWTEGRWSSTLHRVANPPPEAAQQGRISLAFFHQPNFEVLLNEISNARWPLT